VQANSVDGRAAAAPYRRQVLDVDMIAETHDRPAGAIAGGDAPTYGGGASKRATAREVPR